MTRLRVGVPGLAIASFLAGPAALPPFWVIDWLSGADYPLGTPRWPPFGELLLILASTSLLGVVLALPMCFVGSMALSIASERRSWVRHRLVWAGTGLVAAALFGVLMTERPYGAMLGFTGALCALICRADLRSEDD